MKEVQRTEPVYDEKVKKILAGLAKGKTREKLARELGYKSYKSLDIYIRRRHFRWDAHEKTYVPISSGISLPVRETPPISTQEGLAISLFQNSCEPREIARRLGFGDHKELAAFMRSRGYIWCGELGNYIQERERENGSEKKGKEEVVPILETQELEVLLPRHPQLPPQEGMLQLLGYLPLLGFLQGNRARLEQLLEAGEERLLTTVTGQGGVLENNCHYLGPLLEEILEEYCRKRHLSRQEVLEGALVEYFQRSGYICWWKGPD